MPKGVVCILSADTEWRALLKILQPASLDQTPFGGLFESSLGEPGREVMVNFFQGGWGKISAAASAQYAIDRLHPGCLVNLGTCGGFAGLIEQGAILVVERTLVYDIVELMGDPAAHIQHYTTQIDLSWLGGTAIPEPYRRGFLVSADRDLAVEQLRELHDTYGAYAGDWESGAIAWVAQRNHVPLLILRGVSDLVGEQGDETYGNLEAFARSTGPLLEKMIRDLPAWLAHAVF